MNATELDAALRAQARDQGFVALAVADATRLDRDAAALDRWLRQGHQASMDWMERYVDRREDPRRLLPGCVSVISVAMNYGPCEPSPPGRAQVARYAQGRDYHKVLGRRLKALAAWLTEQSGLPARAFVDTGPVLERGWAERAGLGWIGKNANLLRRDHGSWLLLGEVLSAAKLPADAGPHADHCGSCTACIDACPTDAIVSDGVVDARRCIAYWNIEHRGTIPREWREGWEDWIFGCDICQEVCPWNIKFGQPADGDPLSWRDELNGLDPAEILRLDEATFRERYSGTALMRARWDGMRRNACIILGNRADPQGLEPLVEALGDPSSMIRSHAAWGCGRIGGPVAARRLRDLLLVETDPLVREEIETALKRLGGSDEQKCGGA